MSYAGSRYVPVRRTARSEQRDAEIHAATQAKRAANDAFITFMEQFLPAPLGQGKTPTDADKAEAQRLSDVASAIVIPPHLDMPGDR